MIVGFTPGRGLLHRTHPFTPLTLAAWTVVLAVTLPVPWGIGILTAALVALSVAAGLASVLRTAGALALPFWAFLILIHFVVGDDPGKVVGVGLPITAILIAFLAALASVHPARLADALLERRVPFTVTYLLVATLQAVPRLRERAAQILDAQRCRGLRISGSLWSRARAIGPLAMPLVLGALAEVDERAVALEVRGAAAGRRRTPLDPPRDRVPERVLRWVLVVSAGAAVLFRLL
jgi:energy-coupling factor transport system permease protein